MLIFVPASQLAYTQASAPIRDVVEVILFPAQSLQGTVFLTAVILNLVNIALTGIMPIAVEFFFYGVFMLSGTLVGLYRKNLPVVYVADPSLQISHTSGAAERGGNCCRFCRKTRISDLLVFVSCQIQKSVYTFIYVPSHW